jgi:hypothetical protein
VTIVVNKELFLICLNGRVPILAVHCPEVNELLLTDRIRDVRDRIPGTLMRMLWFLTVGAPAGRLREKIRCRLSCRERGVPKTNIAGGGLANGLTSSEIRRQKQEEESKGLDLPELTTRGRQGLARDVTLSAAHEAAQIKAYQINSISSETCCLSRAVLANGISSNRSCSWSQGRGTPDRGDRGTRENP